MRQQRIQYFYNAKVMVYYWLLHCITTQTSFVSPKQQRCLKIYKMFYLLCVVLWHVAVAVVHYRHFLSVSAKCQKSQTKSKWVTNLKKQWSCNHKTEMLCAERQNWNVMILENTDNSFFFLLFIVLTIQGESYGHDESERKFYPHKQPLALIQRPSSGNIAKLPADDRDVPAKK